MIQKDRLWDMQRKRWEIIWVIRATEKNFAWTWFWNMPENMLKYVGKKAYQKRRWKKPKNQRILCCRHRDKKKICWIWRLYIMSRSYKHTPVYKGDKDRFAKKLANRRIRRRTKGNPYDSLTGKSNHYRKENESWDICDYRHWGEPIWREISS